MNSLKKTRIIDLNVKSGIHYETKNEGRILKLIGPLGSGYIDLVKKQTFYNYDFDSSEKKINRTNNNSVKEFFFVEESNNISVINIYCNKKNFLFIKTLVKNLFFGISIGFIKRINLRGVGYRAELNNGILVFKLGYTHVIEFKIPSQIYITLVSKTLLEIKGINPYLVSQVAHNIRNLQVPEPYNGKGIFIDDETIVLKQGKKQ